MWKMMHSTDYGTVPAFLHKLWTLVEDDSTDELITWDLSGKSFHVFDQNRFSKEVLPLYFKHNNIASFVRQLNMYGFRKVSSVEHGGLKIEKDDMEFSHPYFIKGEENLLEKIKRKVTTGKVDDVKVKPDDVSKVLRDVHGIKGRQENISSKMENIERENEALWREVASLRQKHHKQQKIVNKLIQFLVTLVGNHSMTSGLKRKVPLMINDVSQLEGGPRPPKMARQYSVENRPGTTSNIQILPDTAPSLKIKEMVEPVTVQQVPTYTVVNAPAQPQPQAQATSQPTPPQAYIIVNPVKQETVNQASKPQEILTQEMYVTSPPSEDVSLPQEMSSDITFDDVSDLFQATEDLCASSSEADNTELTSQSVSSSENNSTLPSTTVTTVAIPHGSKTVGGLSDMSGQINSIEDSLDGLKSLLAGTVDPASLGSLRLDTDTLLGLFTPEAPIPPTPESFLNWTDDGKPTFTSDQAEDNQSSQMVQYNPTDDMWNLFDTDVVSPAGSNNDLLSYDVDDSGLNTPISLDVTSPLALRRKSKSTSHSTEDVD